MADNLEGVTNDGTTDPTTDVKRQKQMSEGKTKDGETMDGITGERETENGKTKDDETNGEARDGETNYEETNNGTSEDDETMDDGTKDVETMDDEIMDDETKDGETKDQTKDDQTKDGETKDGKTMDDETMDGETKDGETKGGKTMDDETMDGETRDDETKDDQTKDGETKDGETKDGETKDGESKDGESKDGESKDGESKDGESNETRDGTNDSESVDKSNDPTDPKTKVKEVEGGGHQRKGKSENTSQESPKVSNNTANPEGIRIKTETTEPESANQSEHCTALIKMETCVHFDPAKLTEQTSQDNTGSGETSRTSVKREPGETEPNEPNSVDDVVEVTEITTIIKPEKETEHDDLIELSTDDEEEQGTTVLDIRGTIFENSEQTPFQIDEDSDAELCVDLLDSEDDTEEEGVWRYGKDVSVKKHQQETSERGKTMQASPGRFMSMSQTADVANEKRKAKGGASKGSSVPFKKLKHENPEGDLELKIASTRTADSWDEDIPLYERLVHTTKPYSNAKGIKLPSLEARINAEVQKADLKEIPGGKKKKLLKKAMLQDAKIKRDFHKSLENSYKERNEANSLLRSITEEKETIVQCLSDDEDLDDDEEDAVTQVKEEQEEVEKEDSDMDLITVEDEKEEETPGRKPTTGRLCTKCNVEFHTGKSYRNHSCVSQVKVLSKGLFTCTQCNKRFDCKGHLMNHLAIHEPANKYRRKFTCRFCHIVFSARSMQSKHEKVFHADLMTYDCAHCDRKFPSRTLRLNHERDARHGAWHAIPNQDMIDLTAKFASGELNQFPHNCKVCRRSFSRGSSLMQHMASASHRDKSEWAERQDKIQATRRQRLSNSDSLISYKGNLLSNKNNPVSDEDNAEPVTTLKQEVFPE